MKNIKDIKERYMKDTLKIRLGGLASNLARLSSFAGNPSNNKAVMDILEESKFFIEWITPEAPFKTQAFLSGIQPRLALWQLNWAKQAKSPKEINKIVKKTKTWSLSLLKTTGLL